jgi:hypothetical protein
MSPQGSEDRPAEPIATIMTVRFLVPGVKLIGDASAALS